MKKYIISAVVCLVAIFSLSFSSSALAESAEKDMLLVFDASGSMKDEFGGVPRIDSLKEAVGSLLGSLDTSVMVGLRPFAHIKKDIQADACKVTTLAQRFTSERSIINTQTSLLQAVGSYTPLAYTLTTAGGDFKVGNDNVLILLTDGKDTCGGDPVKAAGELFNSSKKIKVYVIGMGVDSDTKKQLALIASTGGGVYYDANNSSSLASSFVAIQNLERPKERVEVLKPLGGSAVDGGNGISDAEYIFKNNDYRLKDSLAPGQYAYFKFPVGHYSTYSDESRKLKITFTILGDRYGVSYNSTNNSFEESNLHNYRMEFFDDKLFKTTSPIEIVGDNQAKRSFVISGSECAGGADGNDTYYCFFKIGSEDFAISKYDLFRIEIAQEGDEALLAATNEGKAEAGDESKNGTSSNVLIYILSGAVVLLLAIIGVTMFVLLKKKNTPIGTGSVDTNIPPVN
jgi:hypothetical protein